MTEINRRKAIGAGALTIGGVAALTTAGGGTAAVAEAGGAAASAKTDPKLNPSPHLFKLTAAEPSTFDGGTLQGAHEENFPVLKGQEGSVYLVHLEVGGVREPHWHPTAWELNYIVSGKAKWTILGTHPDGDYHNDVFDAGQGDLVFAPQGFFHYFENGSKTQPLEVLVIFNTSSIEPNDDIGIVGTLNSIPRDVLAASFGVPVSAFDQVPKDIKPVVITRRK